MLYTSADGLAWAAAERSRCPTWPRSSTWVLFLSSGSHFVAGPGDPPRVFLTPLARVRVPPRRRLPGRNRCLGYVNTSCCAGGWFPSGRAALRGEEALPNQGVQAVTAQTSGSACGWMPLRRGAPRGRPGLTNFRIPLQPLVVGDWSGLCVT